jgi:hypothetical protein
MLPALAVGTQLAAVAEAAAEALFVQVKVSPVKACPGETTVGVPLKAALMSAAEAVTVKVASSHGSGGVPEAPGAQTR